MISKLTIFAGFIVQVCNNVVFL